MPFTPQGRSARSGSEAWVAGAAQDEAASVSSRSTDCLSGTEGGLPLGLPLPPPRFRAAPDQDDVLAPLAPASSTESTSDSPPFALPPPLMQFSNGTYRRLEASVSVPYDLSCQQGPQGVLGLQGQQAVADELSASSSDLLLHQSARSAGPRGPGSGSVSRSTVSLPGELAGLAALGLAYLLPEELRAAAESARAAAPRRAASCESMPHLASPSPSPPSPSSPAPSPTLL